MCVGSYHGHVGSLCAQSICESCIFLRSIQCKYVLAQRHKRLKSKHICCHAAIQRFLRSLLQAIYCIFNFKLVQKGDSPGIFCCRLATQFPLKLSVGFCCEKMMILQERKTCADMGGSCASGMIKDQSQWDDCKALAWDLGNLYSMLCNCVSLIRGSLRLPKTQSCWSSASRTSKFLSQQLPGLTLKAAISI